MIRDSIIALGNILLPGHCVLCNKPAGNSGGICRVCAEGLPRNDRRCRLCAQPLPQDSSPGLLCGVCLNTSPPYDSCTAPFIYSEPLSGLHRRFKFHNDLAAGRALGELLAETLMQQRRNFPQLIIPVPLGRSRLKRRGFNQAIELALPVSRRLDIPLSRLAVKRQQETQPQSGLTRKARRTNVRGAFALRGKISTPHVAIVDDVMTTGFTINEVARLLRRAGAERIDVWVLARTA